MRPAYEHLCSTQAVGQCCATARWRESNGGGFTSSPAHTARVVPFMGTVLRHLAVARVQRGRLYFKPVTRCACGAFHLRLAYEHLCSTRAQMKSPMHSRASGL